MSQKKQLAIPKSVFRRIVKDEIAPGNISIGKDYLITKEALATLQGAAERYMVDMFAAATHQSATQKRVTLRVSDIEAARLMAALPKPNTIAAYDTEMDARLMGMGMGMAVEEEEAGVAAAEAAFSALA